MNKKHIKLLKNITKRLTLSMVLLGLFLSGVSVDEVRDYVKDRNVVDVMWQAQNSKSVVDLFQPERAYAAFSGVTARGSAVNSANHTSLSVSPSANLTVGKLVIVTAVSNNKQTTDGDSTEHTISDTQGHTWNKVFERTETDGAQNDGSTSSLWWTIVTTQIGTGNSITNTYTNSTNNAGIIAITEATFDNANNNIVADGNTPTHSASGSSISHSRSSLTNREYLWFGFHGAEGSDNSKTPITNYTERFDLRSGTTASTDVQMHVGTRILTGTGDTWRSSATTYTSGIQSLTAFYETPKPTTTLSDSSDPGNSTLAPGASVTDIDQFAFTTSSGTDTITALTVTLAPASSFDNLSKVEITNTSNTDVCTDIDNPSSVTLNFSGCSISATTGGNTYKIRITPKTHANMPAVPGASYGTSATVTGWTGDSSYVKSGTDTDSATITVDNLSPNNATSVTASAGDTVVDLAWTNSNSSDFDEIIILRHTSAISDVPVEGTEYSVGNTIGSATVVCNTTSTSCQDTSLSNGTAYHYKIFSQDSNGNYDAGVVPTGSPATPSVISTISGVVYTNDAASTPFDCSSTNLTVRVAVNGTLTGTPVACTLNTGVYSITGVTGLSAGAVVSVFVDTATSANQSATITRASGSGDLTGLQVIQGRVTVRDEDGTSITNANIGQYDADNNANIPFTSNSNNLSVTAGHKLLVWTGKTYTPGGTVTTASASTAGNIDGDITIQSGATLAMGTNALSVGGDFTNSGSFTYGTQTTTFTATGSGFAIEDGTDNFHNVTFNGSGGGWSFSSAVTLAGDLTVTAGTLSGTNNITVNDGDATGNGTINLTGGTFLLDGAGNFGGDTAWTFSGLTFGDGSGVTSSTATGSGGVTISGVLTIATNQTFDASSKTYTLSGSGTPLVVSGTFTANTSTTQYTSTSATNITATTYNNLSLIPAGTVTYTLGTASSQTITVNGAFLIGNGTNALTASAASHDPSINTYGGVTVSANATLSGGSGSRAFFLLGGSSLTVNGTMNIGYLRMDGDGGQLSGSGLITVVNIRFGDTDGSEQTTSTGSGILTVTNQFQITNSHTFNAGSRTYVLSGSGTPFPQTGLFATGIFNAQTSTFEYTGTSATNVAATTYNNLSLIPAGTVTYTLGTASSQTIRTNGTFLIGNGSNAVTVTSATYNPALDVRGDMTLAASAIYTKGSGTTTFQKGSTQTLTDNTSGVGQDLGAVRVSVNSTNTTLNLATKAHMTSLIIDASQTFSHNGSNTLTLSGTGTPLTISGTYTPSTGTTSYTGATANLNATNYNHLTLSSGTYTAPGGTLTISGNYTNGGTFTHNSGTVVFNDAGQESTLSGATTFNNLTVATANKTIKFTSGQTFTTNGVLTLTGTAGNPVVITSSDGSTQWFINHQGTESVDYISISYSGCDVSSTSITTTNSTGEGSVDSCWDVTIASPSFDILHYIWRKDDGSESSATNIKNEDTAVSGDDRINIGDKVRLRILVSNAGTGSGSGTSFRVEYASSSCLQWAQVPTLASLQNEHWRMSSSVHATDSSATTDYAGLTNPGGKTFIPGYFMHTNSQTPSQIVSNTQFTEHEFTIRSTFEAQAGLTYCFRLTDAGSTTNFTYSVQPQAVLSSTLGPQNGGVLFEIGGSGVLRSGGDATGGGGSEDGGSGPPVGGGGAGGGGGDVGGAFISWEGETSFIVLLIDLKLKELSSLLALLRVSD